MTNRNPPDPYGDARHLRIADFCDALVKAADDTGDGIKWRAFVPREGVARELARRGMELCEECADFDPTKKRFFAMPVKTSIKPEYP